MLNDREHKLGQACTNNDNAKNKIGEHPMVYFPTFLDDEKSLVENHCCITYPSVAVVVAALSQLVFFLIPVFQVSFGVVHRFFGT